MLRAGRLLLFSILGCVGLTAAEPLVDPAALPRVPPTEPTNALSTFQIRPGFRLDLVAAEPLVVDPIAMCFDENGRLYVIEMRDYSERRDERLGRVRLLEDVNGDGVYEKSTIFAQDLAWPTAIICYDGGVFVGTTPEILYLKDTNGDNVADERRTIFTGFAAGGDRLNVQGLMNSFNWTLDNRIHGATGLMGAKVRCALDPQGKILELRGKDFSFDPRNPSDIRAESGGGQHGLTFTDEGRKLVCHNSAHIKLVMYEDPYANRNPYYAMPPPTIDIAVDGPAAEVYRISPTEPWRILRTAWRVAGTVSGPVEGGGRASGYFTSATGVTVYRGDAFPDEYHGDAFIADVGSNLIHRKKLYSKGVALEARRAEDEQKSEFIASKDLWFRPVQFANAPDGCLYLADMYREVVEHPWSIPESIKQHLDLNSGNDRGRIYRIRPRDFKRLKPPALGNQGMSELVRLLESANGWTRDTAARLLYQRQEKACVAPLEKLAHESKNSLGRMHALYALHGQNALSDAVLLKALTDADERVREHAVRLGADRPRLRGNITPMADDKSPRVRYEVAFAIGSELRRFPATDYADPWMRAAILNSFTNSEMAVRAWQPEAPAEFRAGLAEIAGAANVPSYTGQLAQKIGGDLISAEALARGLTRAGGHLWEIENVEPQFVNVASRCLTNRSEAETRRIKAAQVLGYAKEPNPALFKLLGPAEPDPVQVAALNAISQFREPSVAPRILGNWEIMSPRLRSETLSVLLARPERVSALLEAISNGLVQRKELSTTQMKGLLAHKDTSVRERAAKVLGQLNAPARTEVVAAFRDALSLKGDAQHGQKLYSERCASCHRLGREGFALGPDLITVKTAGKEKLLESILDPNREVLPQYVAQLIDTKEGDSRVGITANESANSITLREAFGKETIIPRASIQKIESQRQSMMPEGLEAGMTPQDMADLLEFIATAEAK